MTIPPDGEEVKLPLFVDSSSNPKMNLFGGYMVNNLGGKQNMQHYTFELNGLQRQIETKFPAITGKDGEEISETFQISKETIANFETLTWLAPYWRVDDPSIVGKVHEVYQRILHRYSAVK